MRIALVTHAPPGTHTGNRTTALRWQRILEELGHEVELLQEWTDEPADLLIALHAEHSAPSVEEWRATRGDAPVIVALTGTDLYQYLPDSEVAVASVKTATRLVMLHEPVAAPLPPGCEAKLRVIRQSLAVPEDLAHGSRAAAESSEDGFLVCVVAHLRSVKDPLLAARAARRLPASSGVRIELIGAVLDPELGEQARREERENPRFHHAGELDHAETLRRMARSKLLALTSELEGGANCVSEAIVLRVPVVSTRIAGSVGLLGADYPGYFEVGDADGLARLLARCEQEPEFLADLGARGAAHADEFTPERERESWRALLAELV